MESLQKKFEEELAKFQKTQSGNFTLIILEYLEIKLFLF